MASAIVQTNQIELFRSGELLGATSRPTSGKPFPPAVASPGQEYDADSHSDFFEGDPSDVVIFARTLDDAEHQKVVSALMNKYRNRPVQFRVLIA